MHNCSHLTNPGATKVSSSIPSMFKGSLYCIVSLPVVFGPFFQVPQSLPSNSPQNRPTKWCFVMFFWDYCHFPLLPFIHSLPVLWLFCQVMPQVDLWIPLIVCCSPKGKCRQMDLSPTGSFLLLFSRLLWTSRFPEKLREKKFSAPALFFHTLSLLSSLVSLQCFFSYHIKQRVGSGWLNPCWMLFWSGAQSETFAQWPLNNLKLVFVFCNWTFLPVSLNANVTAKCL